MLYLQNNTSKKMNDATSLMKFSEEYLKDKDLKQEYRKALKWCKENNRLTQEISEAKDQSPEQKQQVLSLALAAYLRHLQQEQSEQV